MNPRLPDFKIAEMLKSLPAWSWRSGKLHRSLKFKNFIEAFAFMTLCALEAEEMNHHPEWSNVYATVEIDLQTHDSGGVTELDFLLAQKIEEFAAPYLKAV